MGVHHLNFILRTRYVLRVQSPVDAHERRQNLVRASHGLCAMGRPLVASSIVITAMKGCA
jgi:hypothetical protein